MEKFINKKFLDNILACRDSINNLKDYRGFFSNLLDLPVSVEEAVSIYSRAALKCGVVRTLARVYWSVNCTLPRRRLLDLASKFIVVSNHADAPRIIRLVAEYVTDPSITDEAVISRMNKLVTVIGSVFEIDLKKDI